MDNARRRRPRRLAQFVTFGAALAAIGCGGGPKTGALIEDAPGQDAGEQASREEMERLMKQGMTQ
jgi:hypothetical protein